MTVITDQAAETTAHLTQERWDRANRHLVRKAIAEFSHERILHPESLGINRYRLASATSEYRFTAQVLELEHWSIPAESIIRFKDGDEVALDALEFITEFHEELGISVPMLPTYLEEITSTLGSSAYKQLKSSLSSAELAAGASGGKDRAADFQAVERSMTEGHPSFVANNGRIGFGVGDYLAYAPETGAPVQLTWIAAHRDKAVFTSSSGLDYRSHLDAELGPWQVALFDAELSALGLDPAHYLLMPVHPWQWQNKLTITFAAEIAQRNIVHLGEGRDTYQAQQSIRTFFNRAEPGRCYVKTAISVLNMGFMRGLSPQYMKATPAINDWLHALVGDDHVLQRANFEILREVAAIGYHNHYFEAASAKGSPYRKMLSALWRESPLPSLRDGEQLATMASLLHVDDQGAPFASELIEQSGLGAEEWLSRYLQAYLVPLIHCLYRYEFAFMPHGENVIMVLQGGAPVRMIMKDIAEEIVVMGEADHLPDEVARIKVDIPESEMVLAIFTDVFDCIFRFLAALLHEDGKLDQDDFWRTVAAVVSDYQADHPELAEAFAKHDLFADDFAFSCLNRLQLRNNQQMLDITDPSGGLQFSGTMRNPLAGRRP